MPAGLLPGLLLHHLQVFPLKSRCVAATTCSFLSKIWRPGARPSFYSHWNAPGIVMAVGNTGEYLDTAADATCTWLSRDGGLTWKVIPSFSSIPQGTVT